MVAATIDIGFTRDRFRRAWVVAIPTAFWFAWYFGWGREAENFVSFHNFQTLIGYVADGLSSSLSSLLGLAIPRDEMTLNPLDWGRPLLRDRDRGRHLAGREGRGRGDAAAALGGARRAAGLLVAVRPQRGLLRPGDLGPLPDRRRRPLGDDRRRAAPGRPGRAARRPRSWSRSGCSRRWRTSRCCETSAGGLANIAEQQRGGLAALELTRGEVADDFELTEENSGVDYLGIVDAASYFSAIDEFGSPAYTPDELAAAPDSARVAADRVFAAALGLGLTDADALRRDRLRTGPPRGRAGPDPDPAGRRRSCTPTTAGRRSESAATRPRVRR